MFFLSYFKRLTIMEILNIFKGVIAFMLIGYASGYFAINFYIKYKKEEKKNISLIQKFFEVNQELKVLREEVSVMIGEVAHLENELKKIVKTVINKNN